VEVDRPSSIFAIHSRKRTRAEQRRNRVVTVNAESFNSEVLLEPDEHNGLTVASAAQCQHLRAVSPRRILAVRGNVGTVSLAQIRDTIAVLLDIP
jgi:mRNA interferase MazF